MNKFSQEANQISDLQKRIARRLHQLGFVDSEAEGEIVHHLAEVAVLGGKIATVSLPQFLSLTADQRDKLAELVVDIQTDLDEIKEAISDMEASLLKLVNFLSS